MNKGNSNIITENHSRILNLPMIKFESIFDFYSEEPPAISVQIGVNEQKIIHEQILRMRQWNVEKPCFSWTIYSPEREELRGIVIRKVEWDIGKDKELIKANIREFPQEYVEKWPDITTVNYYIELSHYKDIRNALNNLDNIIRSGIVLEKNDNPNWEWRDLEVKRLYDWGQIHNTWSTHMKNQRVENVLKTLIDILNFYSDKIENKVQVIDLRYSVLPESYKSLI